MKSIKLLLLSSLIGASFCCLSQTLPKLTEDDTQLGSYLNNHFKIENTVKFPQVNEKDSVVLYFLSNDGLTSIVNSGISRVINVKDYFTIKSKNAISVEEVYQIFSKLYEEIKDLSLTGIEKRFKKLDKYCDGTEVESEYYYNVKRNGSQKITSLKVEMKNKVIGEFKLAIKQINSNEIYMETFMTSL